jgi:L-threonylcarbamoyladenylate synthase
VTDLSQLGVSAAQIAEAAELIRSGKLVAFPTETVYGLAANALDPVAVERIYEAKGRPHSSPIICHVNGLAMLHQIVAAWPVTAQKLAEKFWPGPLTLVLPKTAAVPDLVTAGLPTVGVRMPAHPIALALLTAAGVPIAAPSANRFTAVSPTTADHVRLSLGDRVDYILDGGPCQVGIESTVLTLAEATLVLLRPGGISRQQIEEVIGPIASAEAQPTGAAHPSPGLHPRHYSPRTQLYLVENGEVPGDGRGAYLQLSHAPTVAVTGVVLMPNGPAGYAARLYAVLHQLDSKGLEWIAVDTPPDLPGWEAVLDRLKRASAGAC